MVQRSSAARGSLLVFASTRFVLVLVLVLVLVFVCASVVYEGATIDARVPNRAHGKKGRIVSP